MEPAMDFGQDMPERHEIQLVDVLHALADPVRLQIVRHLADADGDAACSTIPLPVTKSTASHHYRVLREAGVTRVRCEGTHRYHSLRRDDLDARFPGLLDSVLASSAEGSPPHA
jgi:DNA-binding transcriptional ArsR family regulator